MPADSTRISTGRVRHKLSSVWLMVVARLHRKRPGRDFHNEVEPIRGVVDETSYRWATKHENTDHRANLVETCRSMMRIGPAWHWATRTSDAPWNEHDD